MIPLNSACIELEFLMAFRRNANGSWSALRHVSLGGVTIGPDFTFSHGVSLGGLDLAGALRALAAKYPRAVQT